MIRVMSLPPLATVQDLGRDGHWFEGLGRAGAMDPVSHRIANMLLGNNAGAATLEIPLTPAQFRFDTRQAFAIAGAVCGARLAGRPLPRIYAGLAKAGEVLELGAIRTGTRLYLALPGGIDVAQVLGSRSTQLREAFGGYEGRVLVPGDLLKPMTQSDPALPPSGISLDLPEFGLPDDGTIHLRALPSTEHDSFETASQIAFWSEPYLVTRQNDRQGHRLNGPVLTRNSTGELRSHGIVPGIVQVPGGGLPIIQLADSATMGGYPKIAAIIEPDLWRMGQVRPGDRVWFHRVGLAEAARAADDHEAALANAGQAWPKPLSNKKSGPDMMTLDQVNKLAGTMIANGVTSLEIKGKDYAVRLVRAPSGTPVVAEATGSGPERTQALSPTTGPFHHRGGDDGFPDLERGAHVLAGEPLGYVGIGPVRLLCASPATGTLVGHLPQQGETVSTGDPLFTVEFRT